MESNVIEIEFIKKTAESISVVLWDYIQEDKFTHFFSVFVAEQEVENRQEICDIILSLADFFSFEKATLIYAFGLLDAFITATKSHLTSKNILLTFLTALIISMKFNEDNILNSKYICSCLGLEKEQLGTMEIVFLEGIKYKAMISRKKFEEYKEYFW